MHTDVQLNYLNLMGIEVWVRRDLPATAQIQPTQATPPVISPSAAAAVTPPAALPQPVVTPLASAPYSASAHPQQLQHYLQLMGIEQWVRRSMSEGDVAAKEISDEQAIAPAATIATQRPLSQQISSPPQPNPPIAAKAEAAPVPTGPLSSLPPPVPAVQPSPSTPVSQAELPESATAASMVNPIPSTPTVVKLDTPSPTSQPLQLLDWAALRERVAACTACELHRSRTQTVFGVGDTHASWLLVGEAPGADEDQQGEPFVGRAGKLLNAMLYAIGLQREQVYIANVLKCRPPDNRTPHPQEIHCCTPFLERQIDLLKPDIVLAVGKIAAQSLLNTSAPLSKLRGQPLTYAGIPLLVTYHPAYLLRRPAEKAKAWADLQLACQMLADHQKAQSKDQGSHS